MCKIPYILNPVSTDSARSSEATEEVVDTAVRLYLGQDQAAKVEQIQSTQEYLYVTAPDTNTNPREAAEWRAKKTQNPTNNHHNSSRNLQTYTIYTRMCGNIRGTLWAGVRRAKLCVEPGRFGPLLPTCCELDCWEVCTQGQRRSSCSRSAQSQKPQNPKNRHHNNKIRLRPYICWTSSRATDTPRSAVWRSELCNGAVKFGPVSPRCGLDWKVCTQGWSRRSRNMTNMPVLQLSQQSNQYRSTKKSPRQRR